MMLPERSHSAPPVAASGTYYIVEQALPDADASPGVTIDAKPTVSHQYSCCDLRTGKGTVDLTAAAITAGLHCGINIAHFDAARNFGSCKCKCPLQQRFILLLETTCSEDAPTSSRSLLRSMQTLGCVNILLRSARALLTDCCCNHRPAGLCL
jgi:hypothetical protein